MLLLSLFILSSCQKDDDLRYLEQNSSTKQELDDNQRTIKKIPLDQILKNAALKKALHLSPYQTNSVDDNSMIAIEGTGFYLTEMDAIEIETNKYQSYTFALYDAEQPDRVVNLLLSRRPDAEDFDSFLIDYELTEQEKDQLREGIVIDEIEDKMNVTPFLEGMSLPISEMSDDEDCFVITIISEPCINGHGWGEPCSYLPGGEDEDPHKAAHIISVEITPCGGSGGDGGGFNDGPPPYNSGDPGNGNGGLVGGGGGSGSGGNSSPSDPNNSDDEAHHPAEGLTLGGGNTIPVIKPVVDEDGPCDDVAEQFEDSDFKEKISQLKGKTSESNEWGFSETSDEGFSNITTDGNSTSFNPNLSATSIGYAHTHAIVENTAGGDMFSPADFLRFRDIVNKIAHNGNVPKTASYGIMLRGTGNNQVNYMLKFNGDYSQTSQHFTSNPPSEKELEKMYRNNIDNYNGNGAKAFLDLVNNKIFDGNLKFKDSGFHLMKFELKADGSLKSSSEVTLDETGKPQTKDC